MNGPIAVLAGTPVDTRMGVAYLEERGLPGAPFPLSGDPREQTAFQHAPAADKRRQALAVLRAPWPRAAGGPSSTATPCLRQWISRGLRRRRECGS